MDDSRDEWNYDAQFRDEQGNYIYEDAAPVISPKSLDKNDSEFLRL